MRGTSAGIGPNGGYPNIPGYQIERPLDEGGFGTVYLATRKIDGVRVAVKVIADPRKGSMEAHGVGLFQRFLAMHPEAVFLLPILAYGRVGKMRYFVMPLAELEEGQPMTLYRHHVSRPMCLNDTLNVGIRIARALEPLHHEELLHRDVKRKNILRRKGLWYLADYSTLCTVKENGPAGRPTSASWLKCPAHITDFREDLYALTKVLFLLPTRITEYPDPPGNPFDPFIQWAEGTKNPFSRTEEKERYDRFGEIIRRGCMLRSARHFASTREFRTCLADLIDAKLIELHVEVDFAQASDVEAATREQLKQLGFEGEIVAVREGSVRLFVRLPAEQADVLLSYVEAGLFEEFHLTTAREVSEVPPLPSTNSGRGGRKIRADKTAVRILARKKTSDEKDAACAFLMDQHSAKHATCPGSTESRRLVPFTRKWLRHSYEQAMLYESIPVLKELFARLRYCAGQPGYAAVLREFFDHPCFLERARCAVWSLAAKARANRMDLEDVGMSAYSLLLDRFTRAGATAPEPDSPFLGYREEATGESGLFGWLSVVWRHACSDVCRRDARQLVETNVLEHLDQTPAKEDPMNDLIRAHEMTQMLEAINDIQDSEVRRVLAGYLGGKCSKEITAETGLSAYRVSTLKNRGIQLVREMLGLAAGE